MVTVTGAAGPVVAWPFALAGKVNGASPTFRIGVLGEGAGGPEIAPVKSADENRVYRSGDHAGFTYQIDIDTP